MLRPVQRLLQWCFLKVEGLFNLAFGDKLNPLYYIGPISYYLMWLIVASGLYLYAFFETSVSGAQASVDALTYGQPWAGGVLRSVHRYASDGVVLTMLLHMARHWAFDRYRGFRWFSWLSGVLLLWLVYVAGINGYMLPWDRLAKFTVVATAEWFDWLPVFNGTLVRNFIFEENVNDRLFSLLSFIHIGVPLALLALLWIHTQRVPQARTSPPLPVAVTLTLALIVLSLVKPAVSQPAGAPGALGFDWFYLPVLALLSRWSAGEVWLLVGAASVLLLALPWLPPRRRGLAHHMLVRPDNRIVAVRAGESLLDAGLREGIALRFDCRSGGCGECKATLRSGTVECGAVQPGVLSAAERAAGVILPCVCTPREDVELEYVPASAPSAAPRRVWGATVESMRRLAPDVMQLMLRLDRDERIAFYAGQYINILLDDGEKRSFSFATAPGEDARIELHIRRIAGGRYTTHVFERMQPGERLRFEGPLGSFFLREDSEKPMIFVAGSTGFAPVKSMLEYAFARGIKRRMVLYWGVRQPEDLYLRELPEQWAREHGNFTFVPVIGGHVHEAILADFPDLGAYQVYACGSAGMVQAAYPAFKAHGLGPDDCFSDAFVARPAPEMARLGGTA